MPKVIAGGFTSTQANSGAVNAGLSISDFQALPSDVQNYYINTSEKQLIAIKEAINNISNGKENSEDVITEIENSNMAPNVKIYFRKLIELAAPTEKKRSILGKGWDKIKSWLGINGE